MKKTLIGLLSFVLLVGGGVSAALSQAQHSLIDDAAEKIVAIMERSSISHIDFSDMIAMMQNSMEDDGIKVEILDALFVSVMDSYFGVESFLECQSYYDGCNTCMVGADLSLACTKRACVQQDIPRCNQYERENEEEEMLPNLDQVAIICEDQGGIRDGEHMECSGIDASVCEENGGRFEECGSACRHDPDAEICTLQCVVFCDFSLVSEREQCLFDGGEWIMTMDGGYTCYIPPADQGVECTDSTECEDLCVVSSMGDEEGTCGSFMGGCVSFLENGEVLTMCE